MKALNKTLLLSFFALFLSLFSIKVDAAKLTGLITDENNQPLPFVIVYISGTTNGTTANIEGMYTLDLDNGNYDVSFRMIGYTLIQKKVEINQPVVKLNVVMTTESVKLKEVVIRANAEDPAYDIIRSAQKKRKFYRDQVEEYTTNAYVKSTQRLLSYPKRVFGQKVDIGDMLDTTTKVFYLSESVSVLSYKATNNYKEKMISSKVSGEPKTYSFNQSTDVLISFYDALVNIGGLTPRGIVSPIAGNSIFYYKFKLEGTFSENGVLVNKISVIPRRNSDPVFTGTIYISENSWRIYNADLFITREQQMEFVDTFRIRQNFIKVNEDVWMPFSHQFDYKFSLLGFNGEGVVQGIFSDYNLSPVFEKGTFGGEVMKVEEGANTKDSTYWSTVRPVPLTDIEANDYQRKDSTRIVHESKSYKDSVDRKSNKFSAGVIISGYSWQNSYKNKSFSIGSPLQTISFNTVEGWNAELNINYTKGFGKDDRREYSISPSLRYGFSNTHLNGHIGFRYRYNPKKLAVLEADAGTDVSQINNQKPISELVNSLYSLLAEKNYMKLFEKKYFIVRHKSELFNGFVFNAELSYMRRNSLSNTSDYKIHNDPSRDYTSNDPYNPSTDDFRFLTHNAIAAEGGVAIRPGQKYINRPDGKYIIGSIFPVFRVVYKKGLNFAGSDVDYDLIRGSIDDEMNLGLLGTFKYIAVYGDFLNSKKLFIPDLRHFNGNKTFLSDFRLNDFKNLDYYSYSTNGSFVELHAEENFGGFFLNKIPLIRKLKLQEVAGVHFLHTNTLDRYFEFSAGVEKLGFFRAEVYTSLMNGKKGTVGFLFGFKTSFGS